MGEQLEKICPFCRKKQTYDTAKVKIVKKNYQLSKIELFYNIRLFSCKNCRRKFYDTELFPLLNVFVEALFAFYINDKNILSNCYKITKNILTKEYKIKFPGLMPYFRLTESSDFKKIINEIPEFDNIESIVELKKIINEFLAAYKICYFNMHKKELYDYQIETNLIEKNTRLSEIKFKISSLVDYISKTSQYKNQRYWFRGHHSKTHRLISGIFRNQNYIGYEVNKLQYFMMRAPAFYKECPTDTDYNKWLPFMQHYELPTRLLDWTDSPLCALFFALYQQCPSKCDEDDMDAAVYAFSPKMWNEKFHKMDYIPILDYKKNDVIDFVERAFKVFYQPIIIEPMAISAVRRYSRMLNQQANFTIHDSSIDMCELQPEKFIKFIIPKDRKEEILKDLYNMGIDKTTFFPELTALADVTKKFA